MQRKRITLLLFALFVLVSACTAQNFEGTLYDTGVLRQPESPLIPGDNTVLVENRWRLVELTYQGSPIAFDTLSPIWMDFDARGGLWLRDNEDCPIGGGLIIAHSQNQYHLVGGGAFPAVQCPEPPGAQMEYSDVAKLIGLTNAYIQEGNALILLGNSDAMEEQVRAVFVADTGNPAP